MATAPIITIPCPWTLAAFVAAEEEPDDSATAAPVDALSPAELLVEIAEEEEEEEDEEVGMLVGGG